MLIAPILLFAFLVTVITCAGYLLFVRPGARLSQLAEVAEAPRVQPKRRFSMLEALGALVPVKPHDVATARADLAAAGYRSNRAVTIFYGAKLAGAMAALLVVVTLHGGIYALLAAPVLAYRSMSYLLKALIARRGEALRLALPDALDLMVVSSEGGSALDHAILKVSQELKTVHPALAEEFAIVNFETLAGKSREEALRNLGERTREPELRKFTSVLVQTDRFGTSMIETLRGQAEYLRTRRRQLAQEKAAKVGVKIIFPIFFLCFPAMLIVVAGPGILQLVKNLFPMMKQMH